MYDLAARLKALADPTRLSILEFLLEPVQTCCVSDEGVCACDIETFLGLAQPTISHHMKLLVQAGFVRARKQGRWVYYALEPDTFKTLQDAFFRYTEAKPVLERG